jgi:hypothetical protein
MTKERALKIQSEQVAYYSQWLPNLADYVAEATQADKLKNGIDYEVYEINQYIPRGAAIEAILQKHNKRVNFSND